MALPPGEKADRRFDRLLNNAKKLRLAKYRNEVAQEFQKAIRAEWAASEEPVWHVGATWEMEVTDSPRGTLVCVTCGALGFYGLAKQFGGAFDTGHFLPGRVASIVLEEENVAPQCVSCNQYLSGNPDRYRQWMFHVRGRRVVEKLEALKRLDVDHTLDWLVERKIEYLDRIKAAEQALRG